MKQLILTFFAVILCYSLFFDKKTEKQAADETNSIHEGVQISDFPPVIPEAMHYITFYYDPSASNAPSIIYVLNKQDNLDFLKAWWSKSENFFYLPYKITDFMMLFLFWKEIDTSI